MLLFAVNITIIVYLRNTPCSNYFHLPSPPTAADCLTDNQQGISQHWMHKLKAVGRLLRTEGKSGQSLEKKK